MSNLVGFLPHIEIVLAVLLIVSILLQKAEAGVSGSFGGSDNFASGFHTRRGFEKKLFYFTILIAVLFAINSLLILVVR